MPVSNQPVLRVSPADVFLSAHTDSALRNLGVPLSRDYLRGVINYYSLVYDHLVISDTPLLHDWLLQDFLLEKNWGYNRLLDEGVLVPAIRESEKTFTNVEALTRENTFRVPVPLPLEHMNMDLADYAAFLDQKTRTRLFYPDTEMAEGFTTRIERYLKDSTVTKALRAKVISDASLRAVERMRRQENKDHYTRTMFYRYAQELEQNKGRRATTSANRLRELTSTIYHENGARALGLQPAYPSPLKDAASQIYEVWVPDLTKLPKSDDIETKVSTHLHASPEDLAGVSYDFISDMRRSKLFKAYISEFQSGSNDATAVDRIYRALSKYLIHVDEQLDLERADRRNKVKQYEWVQKLNLYLSYLNTSMGAVITLASQLAHSVPALGFLGLAFSFSSMPMDAWLSRQVEVQRQDARIIVNELAVRRTEMGRGKDDD